MDHSQAKCFKMLLSSTSGVLFFPQHSVRPLTQALLRSVIAFSLFHSYQVNWFAPTKIPQIGIFNLLLPPGSHFFGIRLQLQVLAGLGSHVWTPSFASWLQLIGSAGSPDPGYPSGGWAEPIAFLPLMVWPKRRMGMAGPGAGGYCGVKVWSLHRVKSLQENQRKEAACEGSGRGQRQSRRRCKGKEREKNQPDVPDQAFCFPFWKNSIF